MGALGGRGREQGMTLSSCCEYCGSLLYMCSWLEGGMPIEHNSSEHFKHTHSSTIVMMFFTSLVGVANLHWLVPCFFSAVLL